MKAKPLINDKTVQIVLEAESPLEMGLLKRFIAGHNGNGESFGAGYSSDGATYGYGYTSISLVSYDHKESETKQADEQSPSPAKQGDKT
jgi:hypothetical protein